MIDRILEILKIKNLSPAQFADMISVQRSSISHLISGRNKPSLEFIQKILHTFPEVNTDWLLSGKGEMMTIKSTGIQKSTDNQTDLLFSEEIGKENIPEPKMPDAEKIVKRKQVEKEIRKNEDQLNQKVEKIVFFYKDNTFKEYFPETV